MTVTLAAQSGSVHEDVVVQFAYGAEAVPVPADAPLATGCTVAVCTYNRREAMEGFLRSLAEHDYPVARLIIVDASPGDETEQLVREFPAVHQLAGAVLYFRVQGKWRGLTRQRNFALQHVPTELVVFFDDDVELLPHCLEEMEQVHRVLGDAVVGSGAVIENESKQVPLFWRMRRALGIISELKPGTYCRSGFAIPWSFLPFTTEWVEGEWLRGCAMMWKTRAAREVGFNAEFFGSSIGEDVDFGLRMREKGKLVMAGKARLLHFTDAAGRHDASAIAYTCLANTYSIHRRCLKNRQWRDIVWFVYAYGMDTLMRAAYILRPGNTRSKCAFVRGRLKFFGQMLAGKV